MLYRPDVCNCTMPYVPRTVPAAYAVRDPAYTAEVFALTLIEIDVKEYRVSVTSYTTLDTYICWSAVTKSINSVWSTTRFSVRTSTSMTFWKVHHSLLIHICYPGCWAQGDWGWGPPVCLQAGRPAGWPSAPLPQRARVRRPLRIRSSTAVLHPSSPIHPPSSFLLHPFIHRLLSVFCQISE